MDPLVHLLKFRSGEQQLIDFPVSQLFGGLCEKRVARSKHSGLGMEDPADLRHMLDALL